DRLATHLQYRAEYREARSLFERALTVKREDIRPRASQCRGEPVEPGAGAEGPRGCGGGPAAARTRSRYHREDLRPRASLHGNAPVESGVGAEEPRGRG